MSGMYNQKVSSGVTKPATIMVVTPHPDDAEFGVAGTVPRWIREGKDVVYIVCTSGERGASDTNIRPEELAIIREQEQLDAAKILGVQEVIFLRYPDQGLEDTPEFRKEVVRYIRMFQPNTVVTVDPYRRYLWHRDHRITGLVTLDAIFPYARDALSYPDLLEQGLLPHKVEEVLFWGAEDLNYRFDITDTFNLKIAALLCHKSQVGDKLNPELRQWLTKRAIEMAKGEDFELAEGFHRVEIMW